MANWVLVELPIDEMRRPIATMSAYVEAPYDALAGVVPDDWLPIQGVAFDRGYSDDYVLFPAIAFPPQDGINIGTVDEEKKIFSLLIDLDQFAPDDLIRIGLYGFIQTYFIVGGTVGVDGPFSGVISGSGIYASLTHDWSGLVAHDSPPELIDAVETLYLDSGPSRDLLLTSFPELAGTPYDTGGIFTGFRTHSTDMPQVGPGDNGYLAGEYFIFPFNDNYDGHTPSVQVVTETWGGSFEKTVVMNASIGDLGAGRYVAGVPSPPTDETMVIRQFSETQYFVPTWKFTNDRTVPINMTFSTLPIWTQQAEHIYPRPARSLTWETADYPTRPEMAEIATAVFPSLDGRLDPDNPYNDYPYNHFGEPRIGTITIINGADGPEVTFMPEVPTPTDGTPDGDGPIGDGTAPGRTDNPQLRAWTFSLDGHDFYVLRLGDFDGLVYDDYSEQWMDWNDFDSLTWRAHCGMNWVGAETLADTYGSNVLVGDDAYGLLWFLDPNQPFDDDPLGSDVPTYFSRVTMGQVPMKGREVLPCYASWLTTDMGDPAYSGAAVTLWTSDDAGATWDNQGSVVVAADEAKPQLSWESLGQIEAPGRLFKIFDDGAVTRIDALEMNDPDDEKASD